MDVDICHAILILFCEGYRVDTSFLIAWKENLRTELLAI
jgi:hypothetical protein